MSILNCAQDLTKNGIFDKSSGTAQAAPLNGASIAKLGVFI